MSVPARSPPTTRASFEAIAPGVGCVKGSADAPIMSAEAARPVEWDESRELRAFTRMLRKPLTGSHAPRANALQDALRPLNCYRPPGRRGAPARRVHSDAERRNERKRSSATCCERATAPEMGCSAGRFALGSAVKSLLGNYLEQSGVWVRSAPFPGIFRSEGPTECSNGPGLLAKDVQVRAAPAHSLRADKARTGQVRPRLFSDRPNWQRAPMAQSGWTGPPRYSLRHGRRFDRRGRPDIRCHVLVGAIPVGDWLRTNARTHSSWRRLECTCLLARQPS
jgi:hypothetical protein